MAPLWVAGPDGHRGDQARAQEEDRLRDRPAQHRRVAAQLHPGQWVAGAGSHPQLWLCGAFLAWGPTWLLLQADLLEWLCALGLPQYHKQLVSSGYDSMGLVAELTWEGLQEIGVNKLGEDGLGLLAGPPRAAHGVQRVCRVQEELEGGSLPGPANPATSLHPAQVIRRSLCWG